MSFFQDQRVLVTGGAGFLGSHVCALLEARGAHVSAPRRAAFDLVDPRQAEACLRETRPDIIVHTAAFYGGMRIHELYPAKIYYDNLVMGAHLMEAARIQGVKKFVSVGSDCAYPGYLNKEVLSEDDLWNGLPHESALDYGVVKKMSIIQGWAYRKQYGFNAIHVILTNMYGPRDAFHPDRSHVVAALIRKFVEAVAAGQPTVEIWGSGKPTRNFLFVEDAAEGLLRATEHYESSEPVNVTTEHGNTVAELAETIARLTGFTGQLSYNTNRPDGQMKKILDVSRMKQHVHWQPTTTLETGLQKTIDWYKAHKAEADAATIAL